MKFLADMGLSQSSVNWLRQNGYDVIHLREEGLQRKTDIEIVKKATKERRTILTCDLDFADLMATSGEICPSIIVFRLQNERPENVNI